jgi:hypothetical protein
MIRNSNFQSLREKGKLLETVKDPTDPDIILGTYSWLEFNIKFSEIIHNYINYDLDRTDRPSNPHGGVMIAAKLTLQLGNIINSNELEVIRDTIKLEGSKKMHICSYYRPPNRTNDAYNNTLAK